VFVPAAIAGFAGFMVLGLFTAVAPAFLAQVLGLSNHALAGLVVFAVFAASTAGQLALERVPQRRALPIGCLILIVGVGLVGAGVSSASLILLLAGAVVAGLGQGLGFSSVRRNRCHLVRGRPRHPAETSETFHRAPSPVRIHGTSF
jgi:MFS family permease